MISKKPNMLYLTKEATDKDRKLKMQMIMSTDTDTKNTQYVWRVDGFFGDQKGDLTVFKKNFPENTLMYSNQGTISMAKGELAIYLINVVLGQVLPMLNCPPDLDNYVCKRNEVKMLVPKYNVETRELKGIERTLGYMMVRGDEDQLLLSYGYDATKSTVVYSSFKQLLRNIFQSTCFKRHHQLLTNERDDPSKLFYYLPSTTDRKETINQYRSNVQLHPINCLYEDFTGFSPKGKYFKPQDLDSRNLEKRGPAKEVVLDFFREAIEVSNSNLRRNVNTLLALGGAKISNDFSMMQGQNQDKFKKSY